MQSRIFWQNWTSDYRSVLYVAAALMASSLVFLWVSYFMGNDAIIHWNKLQEQKVVESTLHTFSMGPFELSIPAENFVILEYFNGSHITPNITASYYFLIILTCCAVILTAVITTFDRFWFIAGIILAGVFVASLRLDVLAIAGRTDYLVPGIAVALVLMTGVYFHFKTDTSFVVRLITFAAIACVIGLVVYFFSGVEYPMLHLTVTAYPAALLLTVLFIFLVAHEIMAGFVFIISRSETGTKSLQHFVVISFIYLANIILTALHEIGVVNWNFIYINLYILLSISGVLGLWGFRERENIYQNILPFHPFGAFLFIALGAIAFATTGALLGNANDAALKVIRELIIFSHAGFGLIFFTYVLSNFIGMLGQNMQVYKVLYKPKTMPYFTFQFAGLIATLAFVFYTGWRLYIYFGIAGFYSNLGDLDLKLGNIEYADAHYEQARGYGFRNHHANYALGKLHSSPFNYDQAHNYYELANGRNPSEYSLINDGNIYVWDNDYFNAIRSYRKAGDIIPNSGPLHNNLGFAYSKVYKTDSAVYFLSKAREHGDTRPSAEANFFATAAIDLIPVRADSLVKLFGSSYPATLANAMALATSQGQLFYVDVDPLKNSHLDLYTATLLNNYIVRHAKDLDTVFVHQAYAVADDSLNEDFSEALKVSLACAYYHQNNVSRALQIMAELVYRSQSYQGKYNYLMGLWALEQQNPEVAASYFEYAIMQDYKDARLYKAIALTEDGQRQEALTAWDTVAAGDDEAEQEMAALIKRILTINPSEATALPDQEKYQFCRYRLHVYDTAFFSSLYPTFTDNNYKANALIDMSQRQFDFGHLSTAIRYLNLIGGLELTDQRLYNKVRHLELLMLAERRELDKLAEQINAGVDFTKQQSLEKMLYTALMSEASGDTLKAGELYAILASYNPYFEEGVIAAADFHRKKNPDSLKPYEILSEAIQVNTNDVKLLKAYMQEAIRVGFDEYAVDVLQRIEQIKAKRRRS